VRSPTQRSGCEVSTAAAGEATPRKQSTTISGRARLSVVSRS
jgi:hypothetical protein